VVFLLRPTLLVYLAAIQLNTEDRLDPFLRRRLLELGVRHYVAVFGQREGASVEFGDPPDVGVG
jgi:hypothetical protein